jgi:FkbM family methyltransferase
MARHLRRGPSSAIVRLDEAASISADLHTAHGRRLFAYGFCEPAARVMRSTLSAGDVMIDGGANIGLFTLLAASTVGRQGRVIACEPAPNTMKLLRDNVGRNGFGWVDLHERALAEAPGLLQLHMFAPGSGFSSFAPANPTSGDQIEVQVDTLDHLAGDFLERTRLVKLDVEGAELRALRGASTLLEHARPDFIIELEPEHLERQGASIPEIQALFDDAGYVGYVIREQTVEPIRGPWGRPTGDPNIVVRPRERPAI